MINELWPDSSTRPWLIGPGWSNIWTEREYHLCEISLDENPNEDFLKKLLQKAGYAMNASTYHIYPGNAIVFSLIMTKLKGVYVVRIRP